MVGWSCAIALTPFTKARDKFRSHIFCLRHRCSRGADRQRWIGEIERPNIFGCRANEPVIADLLQHVRRPASRTAGGKRWRIEVLWQPHAAQHRRCVELHVRINLVAGLYSSSKRKVTSST